jgi:hypothetical protein
VTARTIPWKSAGELRLAPAPENDETEIFAKRFLCRKGGMLLVSATGQGKSTLLVQASYLWTLGRGAFGLVPAKPLKILFIQAENDDGDLREMLQGVERGLGAAGLTEEEMKVADSHLRFITETSITGDDFITRLVLILKEIKNEGFCPDILIVDPVLSYLGKDPSKTDDVSHFLRNGINKISCDHNLSPILIAHTSKPANLRNGQQNRTPLDDVYAALGSVEWANWARGIVVLKPMGGGMFELRAPKRGTRLGWKTPLGERSFARRLAHARDGIYWVEPTEEEFLAGVAMGNGRNQGPSAEEFLNLFPTTLEGDGGMASTLTAAQLKEEFKKRGWRKDSYSSHRDAAEGRGEIRLIPGGRNNEQRFARTEVAAQIAALREEKRGKMEESARKAREQDLKMDDLDSRKGMK